MIALRDSKFPDGEDIADETSDCSFAFTPTSHASRACLKRPPFDRIVHLLPQSHSLPEILGGVDFAPPLPGDFSPFFGSSAIGSLFGAEIVRVGDRSFLDSPHLLTCFEADIPFLVTFSF